MSSSHHFNMRSSISVDSIRFGKKPQERDNYRSVSTTRQTIMGYRPNDIKTSTSLGRESLGIRPDAASLGASTSLIGSTKKNETKPYIEKKKFADLVDNLFAFLSSHDYPHPIIKKNLFSGNKSIFLTILHWLLKLLDPNIELNLMAANEEEIIRILKFIGYPFGFTKNFFAAIGAPSNWSHCIYILNWISELIKYYDELEKMKSNSMPVETATTSTDLDILNEYIKNTFLTGKFDSDNFEQTSQLVDKLTKRGDLLQQNIKDLQLKIENYKLAIKNILMNNPDPAELEFKISQMNDQKFKEEQLNETKKYENSLIYKNIQELKKTNEFNSRQLENLRIEKQNLIDIISSQELNVEEADRLQREIAKNEQTKNKLIATKNEKFKLKYDLIQNFEELSNELENSIQEYNSVIQNERELLGNKCSNIILKVNHDIFDNMDNMNMMDDNITDKFLNINPKTVVKPILKEILDNSIQNLKITEQEIATAKIELHNSEDSLRELFDKIEKDSFNNNQLQESINNKNENLNRENLAFYERKGTLLRDIEILKEENNELEKAKLLETNKIQSLLNEFERAKIENENSKKEISELLNSDFMFVLAHKKEVISTLQDIDSKYDYVYNHINNFLAE